MSGARSAILYGFTPCQLGLCGPGDKKKKKIISRYLGGEKKLKRETEKILKEFKGAYSYYQLIARSNKINNPLDEKVVEAYWTGNNLLDKVPISNFKKMMKNEFLPLGKMPKEKIKNLPNFALPFHNFHVLFIGSVTGRFKETKKGLDLCRISWGKVKKIKSSSIDVKYQPIKLEKKIALSKKSIIKEVKWNKNILPEVKIGDWISMHWNTAIQVLKPNEIKNLIIYTNKILR